MDGGYSYFKRMRDMGENNTAITISAFTKVAGRFSGAIRPCPNTVIEVTLGLNPLPLVIERHVAMVAVRLRIKNPGKGTLHTAIWTLPMADSHVEALEDNMS